jgi:hypothetical protein
VDSCWDGIELSTYLPSLYTYLFILQAVYNMLAYKWSSARGIDVCYHAPKGNILEHEIVV